MTTHGKPKASIYSKEYIALKFCARHCMHIASWHAAFVLYIRLCAAVRLTLNLKQKFTGLRRNKLLFIIPYENYSS